MSFACMCVLIHASKFGFHVHCGFNLFIYTCTYIQMSADLQRSYNLVVAFYSFRIETNY